MKKREWVLSGVKGLRGKAQRHSAGRRDVEAGRPCATGATVPPRSCNDTMPRTDNVAQNPSDAKDKREPAK